MAFAGLLQFEPHQSLPDCVKPLLELWAERSRLFVNVTHREGWTVKSVINTRFHKRHSCVHDVIDAERYKQLLLPQVLTAQGEECACVSVSVRYAIYFS